MDTDPLLHGYTPREVARRYRVSADKVRGWIARGELPAINTTTDRSRKPRWVVTAEGLAYFEANRRASPPPRLPALRKRRPGFVDYFPD
jgi:excisionase family DNA binding protein